MTGITSAQQAINIAQGFIERYYPWHLPVKAQRLDDTWIVEFDVGAVRIEIATVKIDAGTGDVKEFIRAYPGLAPKP